MFRLRNKEVKKEKIIDVFLTKSKEGNIDIILEDSTNNSIGKSLCIATLKTNGILMLNVFTGEIQDFIGIGVNSYDYGEYEEEEV